MIFAPLCIASKQAPPAEKRLTDWLPWITSRAGPNCTWDTPEIGEQVLVLSPSGEMAQGIVLPTLYQNKFPAPQSTAEFTQYAFQDGTQMTYDRRSHRLEISVMDAGELLLKVGSSEIKMDGNKIQLKAKQIDLA